MGQVTADQIANRLAHFGLGATEGFDHPANVCMRPRRYAGLDGIVKRTHDQWHHAERARARKQLTKLAAKGLGLPSIAADAARLAHGTGQALPETRAFQKKGFIELGDEVTEKVQRQKLSVDLPHRLRLDVLKRVFSVEHL